MTEETRPKGISTLSPQEQAKFHVMMWIKLNYPHAAKTKNDEVVVSWFNKMLQNWKAGIFVTSFTGVYFEVTRNDDSRETYLEVYEKLDTAIIPDES